MIPLLDFILHIDTHLSAILQSYGVWAYLILFLIIFCETGLIVTPFLPGDSLLFAAGALSAQGAFNPFLLFGILAFAAILGDTVNYHAGKYIGPRVFRDENKWIKKDYLVHTQQFYKKHGNTALILSRFLPIFRTFAPFVAGVGTMHYGRFLLYNAIGGIVWTGIFIFSGYFFGNIPWVQDNFSIVILGILVLSVLIAVKEFLKHRKHVTVAL